MFLLMIIYTIYDQLRSWREKAQDDDGRMKVHVALFFSGFIWYGRIRPYSAISTTITIITTATTIMAATTRPPPLPTTTTTTRLPLPPMMKTMMGLKLVRTHLEQEGQTMEEIHLEPWVRFLSFHFFSFLRVNDDYSGSRRQDLLPPP
jgi:hypothetical protein